MILKPGLLPLKSYLVFIVSTESKQCDVTGCGRIGATMAPGHLNNLLQVSSAVYFDKEHWPWRKTASNRTFMQIQTLEGYCVRHGVWTQHCCLRLYFSSI
jgi:hypothetical protein